MTSFNPLNNERNIQLVMFDLDGTLVDSVPDLHAAVSAMLIDQGRPPATLEQVRDWVGNGAEILVKRALSNSIEIDSFLPDTVFETAYRSFLQHYQCFNGTEATLYEGSLELIQSLRDAQIKIAIVTNKPEQFTLPLLDKLNLKADLVLSGDSLPTKKPDPAPLNHCLSHFGLDADAAIMIGDSISDIQAARAAKIPVIAVSYGYNHGLPIRDLDTDRVIDSLSELS